MNIDTSPNLIDLALGQPQRPRRVFIETYGCQMNVADSELMAGILQGEGWEKADAPEDADVILVNTCAVREKAEERVFGRVATLNGVKYQRPDVLIGVTGCMAEHLRDKLTERAPWVDLIIGPDAYRRLPDLIQQAEAVRTDPIIDIRLDREETYEGLDPVRKEGITGWVSIQRGCDKFCTFCIVPYTRGRERGVPPREVLRQVRQLVEEGYPEVTLLGQTVNSYRYEDVDFADLVEAVAAIEGVKRIRFTSPYPIDFTPKLIALMAREPKVCKYIHLPVQSGSDDVLDRMRRGYTIAQYRQLVADIRAAMPGIAISTDIITGFPGETEDDFQQTLDLMAELRCSFAFMFKYSERPGTFAHKRLADDVPEDVKGERLRRVIALQEQLGAEEIQRWVGRVEPVLVEGDSRRSPDQWSGRTDAFVTVVFDKNVPGVQRGDLVNVRIDRASAHTLFGQIVP